VRLLTRLVFLFTWRAAALEDRLYRGRTLAAGLHVTAYKPSEAEQVAVAAGMLRDAG
jgi:hypothetical protein